eukprot:9492772-Pyramimonas_sp.AAC.1
MMMMMMMRMRRRRRKRRRMRRIGERRAKETTQGASRAEHKQRALRTEASDTERSKGRGWRGRGEGQGRRKSKGQRGRRSNEDASNKKSDVGIKIRRRLVGVQRRSNDIARIHDDPRRPCERPSPSVVRSIIPSSPIVISQSSSIVVFFDFAASGYVRAGEVLPDGVRRHSERLLHDRTAHQLAAVQTCVCGDGHQAHKGKAFRDEPASIRCKDHETNRVFHYTPIREVL